MNLLHYRIMMNVFTIFFFYIALQLERTSPVTLFGIIVCMQPLFHLLKNSIDVIVDPNELQSFIYIYGMMTIIEAIFFMVGVLQCLN